jgi:uncharacterized protein YbjT (DUF2867 family)
MSGRQIERDLLPPDAGHQHCGVKDDRSHRCIRKPRQPRAEGLLKIVPPDQLVAIVRSPEKAERLASRGVEVRRGDYSVPETLAPALAGVKRLLLVSGSDLGNRVDQHRAVIEAAKAAGVGLIAYTSVLRADTSTLPIADEHKATEELFRGSGIPYVLLRNGWYIENYTERLAMRSARSWGRRATDGSQQPPARTTPLRRSASSRRMDRKAGPTSSPAINPSP